MQTYAGVPLRQGIDAAPVSGANFDVERLVRAALERRDLIDASRRFCHNRCPSKWYMNMDFSAKQALVESQESEVNHLHPFLDALFQRLPGIDYVEYTHGTFEKGADFVLQTTDNILGTTSYIGVIVKKGKISSDISDILRQIDECGDARLIENGQRKVTLREIWVVNSGSISQNAKERIYEKFKREKISFLDSHQITQLVDKHADFLWHQVPSQLGAYLDGLAKLIVAQDKEAAVIGGMSIADECYIEPDIQEIPRLSYTNKNARISSQRLVNFLEEVRINPVSLLEGEMGFGKSRCARRMAQHFASADRFNETRIVPILHSFRRYIEEGDSLSGFLSKVTHAFSKELHKADVTYLVILDGIDEAAVNGGWKDKLRAVIDEARSTPNVRLLLTTRPLRVLDEEVDIYQGAKRYLLRPLSISKVIQFIQQACKAISVPERIFEDLQRSDLFRQLPQSPIAAALLSSLISQNQNDLPSNLTELYSKSIEHMLGRWDVQKGTTPEKEYQAAERVCLRLAEYMVENKLIWLSLAEAHEILQEWHRARNIGVGVEDISVRIFEKSGIFVVDHDNGTISFRHRSFGEYLYARSAHANARPLDLERAFSPYWVACNFFHIGLLRDCKDLLTALFETDTDAEGEEWLKILSMPDYALAGYETEYSVVEDNFFKLFISAAKLYQRVRRGDTKTKLGNLSEMHLLWLFQRLIRTCYDYEFLRRAIPHTIDKIANANISHEDRCFALFFAACFASELNDASGFSYLIENVPIEMMPVPIALSINIEAKARKDVARLPLVKAHEKRLLKMLKPSVHAKHLKQRDASATDKLINELFDRPLRLSKPQATS